MAYLDIVIIGILAVAALWGYHKGLVAQIGAIAAIVVGILACRMLGPDAVAMVCPNGPDETSPLSYYGMAIMVYAVIYFVAYYSIVLVSHLLRLALKTILLGPLDHIGGAVFNVAKFVLVISFLLNLCLFMYPDANLCNESQVMGGRLVEKIISVAPAVVGVVVP